MSPQLPKPALLTSSVGPSLSTSDLRQMERWTQHAAAEGAFLDRSNSVVNPLLASGGYPTLAPSRTAPALIPGDVMEGTVLTVRFPGFDTDSCTDFTDLSVIVRKVSTRAIIVEDEANPANGFVTQDFVDMATDFDGTIYDVDVDFFGAPSDIDSNQRVVIVITKEVNKLTSSPLAFVAHSTFSRSRPARPATKVSTTGRARPTPSARSTPVYICLTMRGSITAGCSRTSSHTSSRAPGARTRGASS